MGSPTRTTARTILSLGILAAAVAPFGGCSSSSGSGAGLVSAADRNKAFTPETDAYAKMGYRHIWTGFPTLSGGSKLGPVKPLDDVVAVQDSAGVLSVLEANSGIARWNDQLGNRLTKFLGIARNGNRIICTSETEAYFLDVDTGTLVGKQRLEKVGSTSPQIVNDLMVYGTSAGEVYGQVIEHGYRAWGTTLPGTISVNPGRLGNTLGFVSSTGAVQFLDAVSGNTFARGQMFNGTLVEPAASKDLLFVASEDQSLYAFSPASSNPIWRHRTNVTLRHRPVYHNGAVYCTIPGEGLTSFAEYGDAGRGRINWVCKDVGGVVIGTRGGRLLTWDGTDACLVDPAKGDLIERVRLTDATQLVTDTFIDGNLYVTTKEGLIVKLAPRR